MLRYEDETIGQDFYFRQLRFIETRPNYVTCNLMLFLRGREMGKIVYHQSSSNKYRRERPEYESYHP